MNNPIYNNTLYGPLIQLLRKEKKLTLKQAASLVNYDTGYLSRVENGLTRIDYAKFYELANKLDFNVSLLEHLNEKHGELINQLFDSSATQNAPFTELYLRAKNVFTEYKGTLFYCIIDVFRFVGSQLDNGISFDDGELNELLEKKDILSLHYQCFLNLACSYYYIVKDDLGIAQEYLNFTEGYKKDHRLTALHFYYQAILYNKQGKPIIAIDCLKQAEEFFKEEYSIRRGINCRLLLATIYRYMSYVKEAIELDKSSLSLLENSSISNKKPLQSILLNNLGWGYFLLEDYKTALDYYLKLSSSNYEIDTYFEIATAYHKLGEKDNCLAYIDEAEQEYGVTNNRTPLMLCIRWLGKYVSRKKGNGNPKELIRIYNRHKNKIPISNKKIILDLAISCFENSGNYEEAYTYLKESINLK